MAEVKSDSGKYLIEKIPHVSGLRRRTFHKTMQLMGTVQGNLVVITRFKTDSNNRKVLMEISDDMKNKIIKSIFVSSCFKWVNHLNKAKNIKMRQEFQD